jgi:hypothetical protein
MATDPILPAVPSGSGNALDRAAVDRVLARAAELQARTPDADGRDAISDEQIIAAGTEAGLTPALIRQALAEERTRVAVPEERGIAAHVAGASVASASRTVRGTTADVLAALNQTMQRDETMMIKRRWADRMTWEPRRDFWAAFRRLAPGGRAFDLFYAHEVAATLAPLDDGRVAVRLDADVSRARAQRLEQGGAVAVGGVTAGGGMVAAALLVHVVMLGAVVSVAALPVAAGLAAGFAIARSHRQVVERTQLALERILDRLEHGDARRLSPSSR